MNTNQRPIGSWTAEHLAWMFERFLRAVPSPGPEVEAGGTIVLSTDSDLLELVHGGSLVCVHRSYLVKAAKTLRWQSDRIAELAAEVEVLKAANAMIDRPERAV